ncbi:transposase [Roseivirga sp. BDSF3-8]|uniref:transposase n=1 Tax=Roseivirga sp. BDSF3-8 TaxID=3241598 RepID=UPI0035318734
MSYERKSYDAAFKKEVVEMSYQRDNIKELANDLGLRPELIYRWRSEYERSSDKSFPGHGKAKLTPEEKKIKQLEKELRDAKMERDILKKAISIFSKNDGRSSNS